LEKYKIPYSCQSIDDDDIKSVVNTLKADFITQGPKVDEFEKKISEYLQSEYCISVNSATSALHLACLALELSDNDILWTSPNSFVSSATCGLMCGANVDFVDIDPETYNISIDALKVKLEDAKKNNTLPKVVIPVHFAGQSCDMKTISNLSKQYGFKIIEDASHALGAKYMNERIGSSTYSDLTVFSFHPVKMITTGEGGIICTKTESLASKIKLLRSHGITRDLESSHDKDNEAWKYKQIMLGYNYRLTDIQAALGISQLKKLNMFIKRRKHLASKYDEELSKLPVRVPYQNSHTDSSYHLYPILIEDETYTRLEIFDKLRASGIGVNVHYIPIHTQPYFEKLGFKPEDFPVSEKYYSKCISLPLYQTMTDDQQNYVIDKLKELLL
jgi:UDP-4-amino-4,6-dideoxy-N-acetyl-beta-L-altrosamine transaminase